MSWRDGIHGVSGLYHVASPGPLYLPGNCSLCDSGPPAERAFCNR